MAQSFSGTAAAAAAAVISFSVESHLFRLRRLLLFLFNCCNLLTSRSRNW
jgi:hypothetical protein